MKKFLTMMVLGVVAMCHGEYVDISKLVDGSVGNGWSFKANVLTITGDVFLTGARDIEMFVPGGVHASLTISNVVIRSELPLGISPTASLDLTVYGENALTNNSHLNGVSGGAGICVPDNATLRVMKESWGKLSVKGNNIAAGIGSSSWINDTQCGRIEIYGGDIVAEGGDVVGTYSNHGGGAAIGGAAGDHGGDIIIGGGCIQVKSNKYSAGIGGGANANGDGGSGGCITISGGTIVSTNAGCAAIGGAYESKSGGTILITGGEIIAKGGSQSAAIGSGRLGGGSTINVTGGRISAIGGEGASAIGNTSDSVIQISGGEISAEGGRDKSAIYAGEIVVDDGFINAVGGRYGVGIGSDTVQNTQGSKIVINGGIINATGGLWGAGIGGNATDEVVINGGDVTAVGSGGAVNGVFGGAAGIGGSMSQGGANVTITGGSVNATGNGGGAGIGGGCFTNELCNGGNIVISGGEVTAKGSRFAAGIGGGSYSDGGTVTISGGTINAKGGLYAAGIGGGYGYYGFGNGGDVYITGGSIKAMSGGYGAQEIGCGKDGILDEPLYDGYLNLNNGRTDVSLVKWAYTNEVALAFDDYLYRYSGNGHEGDENLYFHLPKVDDAGATEVKLIEAGRIYKVNVVDGVVGVESLNGKIDVTGDVVKMNGIHVGEGMDDASRRVRLSVKVGMGSLVDDVVVVYGETLNELMKSPRVIEADCSVEGDVVMFEVDVPKGAETGFFTVRMR